MTRYVLTVQLQGAAEPLRIDYLVQAVDNVGNVEAAFRAMRNTLRGQPNVSSAELERVDTSRLTVA